MGRAWLIGVLCVLAFGARAALHVTGKRDGFASLSVGWRSRTLDVPGNPIPLR